MTRGRVDSPRLVSVEFLREQDGPPEQDLKARLISVFGTKDLLSRAYLAQVRYPPTSYTAVALCLVADKSAQEAIVRDVSAVFAEMAGSNQHLDVLFLTKADEKRLRAVCKPFFSRPPPN